jgi:uncharacterized protein YlxW (UPF0749 family)
VPPVGDEQPTPGTDPRLTDLLRWSAGVCSALTVALLLYVITTLTSLERSNAVIISRQAELSNDHQETKSRVEKLSDKVHNLDARVRAMGLVIKIGN